MPRRARALSLLLLTCTSCVRFGFEPASAGADLASDARRRDGTRDAAGDRRGLDADLGTVLDAPRDRGARELAVDQRRADLGLDALVDPTHLFSLGVGDVGQDDARAVAIDAAGNVYVAGSFQGTVSFGPTPRTSAGDSDAFVASFTPSGDLRWVRVLGGGEADQARGLAITSGGQVVVTGGFRASVIAPFGGITSLASAGAGDIFLALLDGATGAPSWVVGIGGTGQDEGAALALDASDNLYLGATFTQSLSLGGNLFTSAGMTDILLASFTLSGTPRWSKKYGAGSGDWAFAVAVEGSHVCLAGNFGGSVSFGGPAIAATGIDAYLASYNGADGSYRWVEKLGGAGNSEAYALAADPSGNLYVSGTFDGSLDLGGGSIHTSAGSQDLYLASYFSGGGIRWSKRYGGTSYERGHGLAVDALANLYLTGVYASATDFGGGSLPVAGMSDAFLLSLTSAGGFRSARAFSGPSYEHGRAVAVGGGRVAVVGLFRGLVSFGGPPLQAAGSGGSDDLFVVLLQP